MAPAFTASTLRLSAASASWSVGGRPRAPASPATNTIAQSRPNWRAFAARLAKSAIASGALSTYMAGASAPPRPAAKAAHCSAEAGVLGTDGSHYTEQAIMWQAIIHALFILSAIGIAFVDRLSQPPQHRKG